MKVSDMLSRWKDKKAAEDAAKIVTQALRDENRATRDRLSTLINQMKADKGKAGNNA